MKTTIQDLINEVILKDSNFGWTKDSWTEREYIIQYADGAPTGKLKLGTEVPDNILALGIHSGTDAGIVDRVVFDFDVGKGKNPCASTADAIDEARRLKQFLEGHVEIRYSKSGVGVHALVPIPLSWKIGIKDAVQFGKLIAKALRLKADPAALGRQTRFIWARGVNENSFKLIEPAEAFPLSSTPEWMASKSDAAKAMLPIEESAKVPSRADFIQSAREHIAKESPCVAGQGGDAQLFEVAKILIQGYGLSKDESMPLMREFNARCQPPWDESRLEYKIDEAIEHDERHGYLLDTQEKASQATLLVRLSDRAKFFHHENDAFAKVGIDGRQKIFNVNGPEFKSWLTREYWNQYRKAPNSSAYADAKNAIESKARFDFPEEPVFCRTGFKESSIFIDLANEKNEVVEVSPTGVRVLSESPVNFIRRPQSLPLPTPVFGGSIDALRRFLNIENDQQWLLYLAFVLNSMRPQGPYCHLLVSGMQGSSKSTLSRITLRLLDPKGKDSDPRSLVLLSAPKDVQDLMVAAANNSILAFDNLSHLPETLSDALCRLATGGGISKRKLYSDDHEVVLNYMRPAILNGIPHDLSTRSDLLERFIMLDLPAIPPHRRRTEEDLWSEFDAAMPGIYGALLQLLAKGLKEIPNVKLGQYPRMADFTKFAVACLGTDFLKAYEQNQRGIDDLAISANPIGPSLMALLEQVPEWKGTASQLLSALSPFVGIYGPRPKGFPTAANQLSRMLKRLAPNLKNRGIEVYFEHGNARVISLSRINAAQRQQ